MKIFGWGADDAGPGWYRLRVPFDAMPEHDTTVSTEMPDWVLEEADVVVGQRVCQPGAAVRWRRLADGVYGRRPLLVFEIDDDLWDIDPTNLPAWNFYRRNPAMLDNLTRCARLADVCTVSTEPLADVVRKINPNVVVLPNQLPASAFEDQRLHFAEGHVRIGWGGGLSHLLDVQEMTGALRQHFRRRPDDRFVNMGTLFDEVARAVPNTSLEQLDWTTDLARHYRRVADLDIGLAPLRASVFNRSKSEIKFLEYAAAGVPTIASNVGPYERECRPERGAVLVTQQHEWTSALRDMATDGAGRRERGALARRYAETRHIAEHVHEWTAVYSGDY